MSTSLLLEPWTAPFRFSLGLPGSKSLTLRDCALAALAEGPTTVKYPGECDDYWRMKDCLRQLGLSVDDSREEQVTIGGCGGRFAPGERKLFTGQSAVTTRLLLAIASLREGVTHMDAHESMRARPNGPLMEALRSLGAEVTCKREGYLPATVRGTGALRSQVRVPSNLSSQYLTSLLLIGPLLPEGLTVEVEGELVSKPYVDLTLDEMAKFGVQVENEGYRSLRVPKARYQAGTVQVEGDASAASYFAALATLHGSSVSIQNLGSGTRQGDYAFFSLCERLGATVVRKHDGTTIVGPQQLRRIDEAIDMEAMPDVAPTAMMIAPFLEGGMHLIGLSTLRVKECDRIAAPARELRKLGVAVEEGPDFMRIQPLKEGKRPSSEVVDIETYHDHRIAMSFGVLGSLLPGLNILDPGCVAKTYPNYWKDWERCRNASA